MDINKKDNNLIVTGLKDFNLHHIFDCGQCFRFNAVSEKFIFRHCKEQGAFNIAKMMMKLYFMIQLKTILRIFGMITSI